MFIAAKGIKYSFAYMEHITETSRTTVQYPEFTTVEYEGMEKITKKKIAYFAYQLIWWKKITLTFLFNQRLWKEISDMI